MQRGLLATATTSALRGWRRTVRAFATSSPLALLRLVLRGRTPALGTVFAHLTLSRSSESGPSPSSPESRRSGGSSKARPKCAELMTFALLLSEGPSVGDGGLDDSDDSDADRFGRRCRSGIGDS